MRLMMLLGLLVMMPLAGCATAGRDGGGVMNFAQVSEELYRGGQPSARGFHTLASQQIKCVINLRETDDTEEEAQVQAAGMTYLSLTMDVRALTPTDADAFLKLLETAPKPAFVHCHWGRDRTGFAVAAYRVRKQGWTVEAAVDEIYDYGHFWVLFPKVRGAIKELGPGPSTQ